MFIACLVSPFQGFLPVCYSTRQLERRAGDGRYSFQNAVGGTGGLPAVAAALLGDGLLDCLVERPAAADAHGVFVFANGDHFSAYVRYYVIHGGQAVLRYGGDDLLFGDVVAVACDFRVGVGFEPDGDADVGFVESGAGLEIVIRDIAVGIHAEVVIVIADFGPGGVGYEMPDGDVCDLASGLAADRAITAGFYAVTGLGPAATTLLRLLVFVIWLAVFVVCIHFQIPCHTFAFLMCDWYKYAMLVQPAILPPARCYGMKKNRNFRFRDR